MKTTIFSIASLALVANAGAFGLDFTSVPDGTTIGAPLTIVVAGYGSVEFSAGNLVDNSGVSTLEVGTDLLEGGVPTKSLQVETNERVIVRFLGAPVTNVAFGVISVSGDETAVNSAIAPNLFTLAVTGNGDGSGLKNIGFDAIPEPSSAALLGLGVLGLLVRRKR